MPIPAAASAVMSMGGSGGGGGGGGSLINAGVDVIGSLIGQLLASGQQAEAERLLLEASKIYDDIPLPGYEDFKDQVLGPSAMSSIVADPRAREAQYAADERLREMSESGGLLLSDRVAQNEALGQVSRGEQAARARILERMRRSGQAGGGAETAALLTSQQGQANRAADVGMKTAANAEQRVLQSILERGRLGGQMRDQDFGEKSAVARAKDEIDRYNAAARERGVLMRNQIDRSRFDDRMRLSGSRYGARRDRAQAQLAGAQGTRSMWAGIGDGAGDVAGGLYEAYPWDKPEEKP